MAQRQGLSEISGIPGTNRAPEISGLPGTNRAPEIPEILLRSSALSQAYLRPTILESMDTAQKLHAMLLELFCKLKTAHRCNPFARQLLFVKLAKSLPHARSVKIE